MQGHLICTALAMEEILGPLFPAICEQMLGAESGASNPLKRAKPDPEAWTAPRSASSGKGKTKGKGKGKWSQATPRGMLRRHVCARPGRTNGRGELRRAWMWRLPSMPWRSFA